MNLAGQDTGAQVVITGIKGHGAFRRRIIEMGFVKGKVVKVIKNAPLKDPIEYEIMGYKVSLRRSESSLVEVIPIHENSSVCSFISEIVEDGGRSQQRDKSKTIEVALVGNPNSGKTTLFNQASGAREHVGNYSGVTIDSKQGSFRFKDYNIVFTDLPGTYSLTAYSPDELYVRKHLLSETPDIVLNVLVASNLERNLFLTTELIDMDLKVVVALNMYDELEKQRGKLDYKALGSMLGIPFCPTVGSKNEGLDNLFNKIVEVYEGQDKSVRHIHIHYGEEIEDAIEEIKDLVTQNEDFHNKKSPRYVALKLLEGDSESLELLKHSTLKEPIQECISRQVGKITKSLGEDPESVIVNAKYGFISGALRETFTKGNNNNDIRSTEIIDAFVTHKLWGYPIFLLLMWMMFQFTFKLGSYPQDWLQSIIDFLGNKVGTLMPEGPLKDLLVDGIIGGVGSVIVFLPNIMILYAFISFFEDSGYMARAAFIMDKLMHKIGLHGKSFIPLLMGFGCNVPAILSTRTIENRSNRILTILINPLMSCSARLVVYLLFVKAFFPENGSYVLISIYTVGVLIAILMARLFKKTLFKTEESPFVMELPPYRMPTVNATVRHTWNKGVQYLKKMGGIIFFASVIIWFLGYYPRSLEMELNYQSKIEQIQNSPLLSEQEVNDQIRTIRLNEKSDHQENSYIGRIGHFIEPVLKPLGMNWKVGVSLLSGIVAKEVVISTMGVIYNVEDYSKVDDKRKDAGENQLIDQIRLDKWASGIKIGTPVFTPLVAFAFMLFVLIYFPCLAVVVAIKNNSGSWKWALLSIAYSTSLAWFVSFIVYQIGTLMGY